MCRSLSNYVNYMMHCYFSQLIFEEMKKVRFEDESEQLFEFTDEQESNRGYHIYSIRQSAGQIDYQNVRIRK